MGISIKTTIFVVLFVECTINVWCQTSGSSCFQFEQNVENIKTWNVSTRRGDYASITGHMIIPSDYSGLDEYSENYPNDLIYGPVTVIRNINAAISSVHIPNSIKRIDDNGFTFCPELESVVIPNNVEYVGVYAFKSCSNLSSVVVSPNNEVKSSFSGCHIKKGAYPAGKRSFVADIEVSYPNDCIPDSAGFIMSSSASVFYFAPWMSEICELPKSVRSIETKALAGCTKMKKLLIRAQVPPYVADGAFDGANIKSIEIPYGSKEKYLNDGFWSKFASKITESEPELNFTQAEITIKQGKSVILLPFLEDDSLDSSLITWKSTNPNIATVDYGLVTAISVGSSVISAEYGNSEDFITVNVVSDSVSEQRIEVNGLSFSLHEIGSSYEAHLERPLSGVYEEKEYIIPKSIEIHDTSYIVTEISKNAFFKDYAHIIKLEKISIPSTVRIIGERAFYGATSLQTVEIAAQSNLTHIQNEAFKECANLKSISFSSSLISIGNEAFYNCSSLERVEFGTSLKEISYSCFHGCSKLNFIDLPATLEVMGGKAFKDCIALSQISIGNHISELKYRTFENCTSLEHVLLPESLGIIREGVFNGCSSLKGIDIPSSVSQICAEAFKDCISLEHLSLPFYGNLQAIGYSSFENCSKLSTLIIPPRCWYQVGGTTDSFKGCIGLVKCAYSSLNNKPPVNSGATIQYTADNVCYEDNILWSRDKSVIYYVDLNFNGELKIPASVCEIGGSAFEYCTLTNCEIFEIGSNVQSIGSRAFAYCAFPKCDTLEIGSNVKYIGSYAFQGLTSLNNLIIKRGLEVVKMDDCVFEGTKFKSIYQGRNVSNVSYFYEKKPFASNDSLECITIGPNVTLIGSRFYAECPNLKTVIIEDSPNILEFHYGDCVFGNSPFTTLYLGRDVYFDAGYYQSDHPFKHNNALKTLYLGELVTSFRERDFKYCTALENLFILDGSKQLEFDNNLLNDLPLINLQIGRPISATTFNKSKTLKNVWISDIVPSMSNTLFSNCPSIETIYLGDGLSEICENAFYGCTNLKKIRLGKKLQLIGANAFSGCSSITDIYALPETPPLVEEENLSGIDHISTILHHPKGEIYSSTPFWMNFVKHNCNFGITMKANSVLSEPGEVVEIIADIDDTLYAENIVWLSSNPNIAEIENYEVFIEDNLRNIGKSIKARVKVKQETQVTIAAFLSSGQMANCVINKGVPPRSIEIELERSSFTMYIDETSILHATVYPLTAAHNGIIWESSDPLVLYVDDDGNLKACAAGTCTVTATCGYATASCRVTVVPRLVESITISGSNVILKKGHEMKLSTTVTPETATNPKVVWSSSNEKIASVDQEGIVIAHNPGQVKISASAVDESGISDSFILSVIPIIKGDSNDNDQVTITDAVNTANYAVGNEVENFCFEAADVNEDNRITLADASGTVNEVLNQPVQSVVMRTRAISAADALDNIDTLVIADYSCLAGTTTAVDVTLDNSFDYVALQADINVPEGMNIMGVEIGERAEDYHSLMHRRIDARTMRIALFDLNNSPFADNDRPIFKVLIETDRQICGDVAISNIVASDAQANEYVLTSTGGHNSTITGIASVYGEGKVSIVAGFEGVTIYNAEGKDVCVFAIDGTMVAHFTANSNVVSRRLPKGEYIITAGLSSVKVMVK